MADKTEEKKKGIYSRFKDADPMGVREYIKEGKHRFLVKRTEMGPSKNPQKKNMEKTVIEFKVIRSDTAKVGTACSFVETDDKEGYAGNVLSFVAGILGYTIDELKADEDFEAVFDGVFGTDQILVGMLVDCNAQQVKTTKGGDYTAKSWEPVPASEYEADGLVAPDGAYTGEDDKVEAAA